MTCCIIELRVKAFKDAETPVDNTAIRQALNELDQVFRPPFSIQTAPERSLRELAAAKQRVDIDAHLQLHKTHSFRSEAMSRHSNMRTYSRQSLMSEESIDSNTIDTHHEFNPALAVIGERWVGTHIKSEGLSQGMARRGSLRRSRSVNCLHSDSSINLQSSDPEQHGHVLKRDDSQFGRSKSSLETGAVEADDFMRHVLETNADAEGEEWEEEEENEEDSPELSFLR